MFMYDTPECLYIPVFPGLLELLEYFQLQSVLQELLKDLEGAGEPSRQPARSELNPNTTTHITFVLV